MRRTSNTRTWWPGKIVHVDCVLLSVFGIRRANFEDKPLFLLSERITLRLVPLPNTVVPLLSE
jgi:hypothetical protein